MGVCSSRAHVEEPLTAVDPSRLARPRRPFIGVLDGLECLGEPPRGAILDGIECRQEMKLAAPQTALPRDRCRLWLNDAAVDDRRRYLLQLFDTFLRHPRVLLALCMDYVGCLICDDQDYRSYKAQKLGNPMSEHRCEQNHWLFLTYWAKGVQGMDRLYCRYCGLTRAHHRDNRERSTQGVRPSTLAAGRSFIIGMYCRIRCPIHLCRKCRQPFVKTAEHHLCATCLVEFRGKSALQRALSSLDRNCYVDEVDRHVPIPTVKVPRRQAYYRNRPATRGGVFLVWTHETMVDTHKAAQSVSQFLDRTEYTCIKCCERFRLPLIPPLRFASPCNAERTPPSMVDDANAVASIEGVICGFCDTEIADPKSMLRIIEMRACQI